MSQEEIILKNISVKYFISKLDEENIKLFENIIEVISKEEKDRGFQEGKSSARKDFLKIIDIPTWRMNEILCNEGYKNNTFCKCKKENLTFKQLLDITIGFSLAQNEIKQRLQELKK